VISSGTQSLLGGFASGTTVRSGGTQLVGNTFLDVGGMVGNGLVHALSGGSVNVVTFVATGSGGLEIEDANAFMRRTPPTPAAP
jgi:autotransporter passenger strand-loop-strand repeat protein